MELLITQACVDACGSVCVCEWPWGESVLNAALHVGVFTNMYTLFVLSLCRDLCATIAMEESILDWYSHGLPKPTQAREVWEHAPSIKTF